MVSTLVEMGALLRSKPGPDAPTAEVAAWYEDKAALFEHLAVEAGPNTPDGQNDAAIAEGAHRHALDLWSAHWAVLGMVGSGKGAVWPLGAVAGPALATDTGEVS